MFDSNGAEHLTSRTAAITLIHGHDKKPNSCTIRLVKPFPISYISLLEFKYDSLDTKHVTQRRPEWVSVT
jgi:hypothetical protein